MAVHHGRLPRSLGQLFVHLFNEGEIKVLICTSTLIEGVNTSAASVFIYDKKINRTDFDFFSFANIRGRVGRMMRHFVGNAFLYYEPPTEVETNVDVPVLSNPDKATDFLIMNIKPEELSREGLNRQESIPTKIGVSAHIIRDHGSIGVDLLSALSSRIQAMHNDDPTIFAWHHHPQKLQRIAIAELVLLVAHSRRDRTGIHTAKQLAWVWSQLFYRRKLSDFLEWFSSTFSPGNDAEGIDRAFQFLQACEFGFPRTLAAVEALIKDIIPDIEVDYSAYISSMECWFRPPWMKDLDEAGVPLPLAERLELYVGSAPGRAEAFEIIRKIDLNDSNFSRVDHFILELALDAG